MSLTDIYFSALFTHLFLLSSFRSPLPPHRFGYATDETEELMPLSIVLAHKLNAAMAVARRDESLAWLRPDSKTQVTVEYKKDGGAMVPVRVDTVVISTQHAEEITTEDLRKELLEKIVRKVIPANLLDDKTVYHVRPLVLLASALLLH
jgi:S-adenosylmethionine synthetase